VTISIRPNAIHHFTLVVTNVERSFQFYHTLLGFRLLRKAPPRITLVHHNLYMSLTPAANKDDRFAETRVGLDHMSFRVMNRKSLEQAAVLFERQGILHGEIKDLFPLPIYVLAFRDPDNIQLELTAPYSRFRLARLLLTGQLRLD
jgi:catechol 2,3-dioxygenase-like lactoylglutathione lyase family enzyme